jgi:hypothetical protein
MKRIGLILLLVVAGLVVVKPALAQVSEVRVEVMTYPAEVVPSGAKVTFDLLLQLPVDETVIISVIGSERHGDVTDSANPALVDTTCVVPSTREPGDYYGAYDWGCRYRVWLEGDPGEVTDTITVTVVRADGTDVVATTTVSVAIGTATGAIRGTLTDDVTGSPLADVLVMSYGETSGGMSETDEAGQYSMDGLAPGEYRLIAGNSLHQASVYAREWWDDAATFASAGVVTVVGGEVATVDWALSLGGVIEGTVTDVVSGAPLRGVAVSVVSVPEREGPNGAPPTDEAGLYRISGLHTSGYLVCFHAEGYQPECWNDRTDFGSGVAGVPGDPVQVEVRTVVSGIDAALAPLSPPIPEPGPPDTLPFTGVLSISQSLLLALVLSMVGGAALLAGRRPSSDQ